jgi:hypothetical protein
VVDVAPKVVGAMFCCTAGMEFSSMLGRSATSFGNEEAPQARP